MPRPRVTVFVARGCSLCGPALEVVRDAERQVGFELRVVDVTGDEELERAYRERLPVVEIDGRPAFTFVVDPAELRAALERR